MTLLNARLTRRLTLAGGLALRRGLPGLLALLTGRRLPLSLFRLRLSLLRGRLRLPLRPGLRLLLLWALLLWALLGLRLIALRAGRLARLTAFDGRILRQALRAQEPWRGGKCRHRRERQQGTLGCRFVFRILGQGPLLMLRAPA